MGSSPGFGSTPRDFRRPVQTRFRSGCARDWLSLATKRNSPVHSSIGTPSARLGAFDCLRAHGFRNYFTPLIGVLFTFPSRYWSAIGHFEYLALESGLPSFPRAFAVPRGTQERSPAAASGVGYGTLTPFGGPFQGPSPTRAVCNRRRSSPFAAASPYNTQRTEGGDPLGALGLGCSRFARRYYGNCLFSSGYLDVSFPPVASGGPMCSVRGDGV